MKKIFSSILIYLLISIYSSITVALPTQKSLPDIQTQIVSVNHVCLIVSDMQKSLNFYRDLLGFNIIYDKTQNDPDMKLRNVLLITPTHFKLELDQFYRPHGIKLKSHSIFLIAYNHIGIEVKDVNVVYNILKQHKVATYSKPVADKKLGFSYFFAKDPDGNYIEFFQNLNSKPGIIEM